MVFSQTAREIQFILGSKGGGGLAKALKDIAVNVSDAVTEVAGCFSGKNLLTRVAGELITIVSGGKIIFPEIWSGSSYSKSYNITLKLRSPDPDLLLH